MAPLDNQELDKDRNVYDVANEVFEVMSKNIDGDREQAKEQLLAAGELILEEVHRIGNLAIGEYDKHGSGQNTAWEAGVDWCNSLREGQRQRLSKLTGLKNE